MAIDCERLRRLSGGMLSGLDDDPRASVLIDRSVTCAVKGAGSLRVKVPPGNCSFHPVAIGAAVKATKPSEPPV
jgi:hypothetical protein